MRSPAPLPSVPAARSARLAALDVLRGLAALSVALYHFCWNGAYLHGFPADNPIKAISGHGHRGVYVFFVVSGFVLPWAMERGGYRPAHSLRFLGKRLLRIHPPYVVAVLVLVAMELGTHPDALVAVRDGWGAWWRHLFYLNDLTGHPWLLDIFWTLAVEMQFYLAIGLLFPLLTAREAWLRWLCLAGIAGSAFAGGPAVGGIKATALVHHYGGSFALGIAGFWWLTGRLRAWPGAAALLCGTAAVVHTHGYATAWLCLATVLVIVFVPVRNRVLVWLGAVSYPLYLFHLIVGGAIIDAASSLARDPWRDSAVVLVALAASLAAAWVVHRWVETPCQRWSSALRYPARRGTGGIPSRVPVAEGAAGVDLK